MCSEVTPEACHQGRQTCCMRLFVILVSVFIEAFRKQENLTSVARKLLLSIVRKFSYSELITDSFTLRMQLLVRLFTCGASTNRTSQIFRSSDRLCIGSENWETKFPAFGNNRENILFQRYKYRHGCWMVGRERREIGNRWVIVIRRFNIFKSCIRCQ